MYPFVFNPFGRNNTVNILDLVIPKVKTIALGESTENVVLGICPKVWCRLPKRRCNCFRGTPHGRSIGS